MTFFRRMSSAFEHLADRLQGQDIERSTTNRFGRDVAAVMNARTSQGGSPIGFGR